MKILVFGSANIDHVYQMPYLVRAGETLASDDYVKNAGGKGFNQAIALSRAGSDTYFAGAIGKDGLFLKEMLEAEWVDTSHLKVLDVPTGHAVIQVDRDGQNSIILYGGANRSITEEDVNQTLNDFSEGDVLLAQNEINCTPYLIRKAHEKGMTVVLNPSPISPDMKDWPMGLVDLFFINEVEGQALTGETEPEKILDKMLEKYPNCAVVLTLGEMGAYFADQSGCLFEPAVKTDVVDTTAAGDTFTGYFLTGLYGELSPSLALKTAAYASSITVSIKGAAASIPTTNQVCDKMKIGM